MNRTIADIVRCMLFDSEVSLKFSEEAAIIAVYLLNRVPTRSNALCPEEIWSSKKQNLKHVRVFVCKAMVPDEKRSKCSPN